MIKRINSFDWDKSFSEIMIAGGFDSVIGNPPYIRIQTMKEWASLEVEIYRELFDAGKTGNYDIYVIFIEQGLKLLNTKGKLGFICPHKFFNSKYGEPIRKIISSGDHLSHVVNFGDQQVFDGATTYTCLLFLDKSPAKECRFIKVGDLKAWRGDSSGAEGLIQAKQITASEWNFVIGKKASLFERLEKIPLKLGNVTSRIFQGPITSADSVFLFKNFNTDREGITEVVSNELEKRFFIESAILKPVIRSGSIKRYSATPTALVLFPYEVLGSTARLYSTEEMKKRYPNAWEYLNLNRDLLSSRENAKFKDNQWYRFGRTQNLGMWEQPKLMIPYMVTDLAAYLDRDNNYYFINVTTGGYGITSDERAGSLEYLCGLLNSQLLDFYLKLVTTNFHGGYFAANKQFIELLPIRAIDFTNTKDKDIHDRIVTLVQTIHVFNKQMVCAKSEAEKNIVQRQIEAIGSEIDHYVYDLYELTDDEIALLTHKES